MEVGKPLEEAIALSKLMYCNVVWAQMPKYVINRLQRIQYATAEYATSRYVTMSDVINPHWLPIKGHIEISTINLVHRSLRSELCLQGPHQRGSQGAMFPSTFFAKQKKTTKKTVN